MTTGGTALRNRTVVVTRDEDTDGPLSAKLKRRGAHVLLWTTVRFSPPADPAPLRIALTDLESYDWVVFTSTRAVVSVLDVVGQLGEKDRSACRTAARVAAVGPGTARALRTARWPVDLEPEEASSAAVLRSLERNQIKGARILFPASSLAGPTLREGLCKLGATVDEVVAYRVESVPLPNGTAERIQSMIGRDASNEETDGRPNRLSDVPENENTGDRSDNPIDAVCFASPSAVGAWSDVLEPGQFAEFSRQVLVAAIGSTTETALHCVGCENVVVAHEASFLSLADVVVEYLNRTTGT